MMQRRTQSPSRFPGKAGSPPLSVMHADALYRPVPPVEYDDEGYPGPDGNVSESTSHWTAATYTYDALRTWFRDQPNTMVAGDLMVLFEEGNREAALVPDVMVAFGAGNGHRSSYKVWQEGNPMPAFVLEVLSTGTWRKDVRVKPALYAALGVRELWLFEPVGLHLAGYRLDDGAYRPIGPLPDGGLHSAVLELTVLLHDGELRLRDPRTGEILPTHIEAVSARRTAEERARRAERRVAELEAKLAQSDAS